MFFFTIHKRGFVSPIPFLTAFARIFIFVTVFGSGLSLHGINHGPVSGDGGDSWSNYVPSSWQEDIVMPIFNLSVEIISKDPAASGMGGHTDVVLRFTIQNESSMMNDTINCVQIFADLVDQMGMPPFVALTGSLSAMTGSGCAFGDSPLALGIGDDIFEGLLNPDYDGIDNDSLFTSKPVLRPGQCLAVDVSFELGDTTTSEPIVLAFSGDGTLDSDGASVATEEESLTLIEACQSETLACAGQVNVSLGPDCKALISLSTVFLNQVIDPNRYSVVVFDGDINLGDMLDESHVGKDLRYSVLDGCFGGQASCWGDIHLENKNLPRKTTTYQEVFCGEIPSLLTLEQISQNVEDECFVYIFNYREVYADSSNTCNGGLIRRIVLGEYDLDGFKGQDTIHIDSIVERPLEIDSIQRPMGGPDTEDAIYVDCDSLGDGDPTPQFIKDYFNSLPGSLGDGITYAYPYLVRDSTTMEMYSTKDTIIEVPLPDTIIVINGFDVIIRNRFRHDTLTVTDTTFVIKPNLVTLNLGTTCNLTINYSDSFFPGCVGPEGKILRTWSILNWCTGAILSLDQWIIIEDTRGPNITMPDTVNVGISIESCTAAYPLTAEVEDSWSAIRNLNWGSSAGIIDSNNILQQISPSDSPVRVTLQAIDDCGNDSTAILIINVIDSIAPVALAKDTINTTITYDLINDRGIGVVTAESIDAGSHDSHCGPITICVLLDDELKEPILDDNGAQVRDSEGNLIYRAIQCAVDGTYEGIPYVICKDHVKFCCDQIGHHRVALLVDDFSDGSGTGISWTVVNVEDKSFPIVTCQDVIVFCGDDIHPDSIGYPNVSNGLCSEAVLRYSDEEDIGDCGEGLINRYWLFEEDTACVQKIIVERSSVFDPRGIKWPKHYTDGSLEGIIRTCDQDTLWEKTGRIEMGSSFVCGEDTLDEPVWCDEACSLLLMSYEDQDVEDGEACKKIIRTWTVIDWCNYVPNGNEPELDDDTFEAVSDEEIDTPNILSNIENGFICQSCEKPSGETSPEIFFRYTSVDVDGFYTYEQVIRVLDDTPPVVDAPEEVIVEVTGGATSKNDDFEGCDTATIVSASVIELCGDIVLDASTVRWLIEVYDEDSVVINTKVAFGDSVSMMVRGAGNTEQTISWLVSDGCGNEGSGSTTVFFTDIIDPVPLCITGISIATMNDADGTATIWAEDYDRGSFDNCSDLKYFFKNGEGIVTPSLIFTCDDIPNGRSTIKHVEVFVSDEAGNESSCNVSIRIDDNNDICIDSAVGSAAISGQIMTSLGDMIESARVLLNDEELNVTGANGIYSFDNIPMASSYKITSKKNDDPLNGVSTLDLVLIQRHILALDTFDTAYKAISADITNDQRISAIDLVQLRRLILGKTDEFVNNESWRFVDPNQEFDNPLQPWPFREEIIIENLSQDMDQQDLFGVKIGDVSGNAIANSLLAENRSVKTLDIEIEDAYIKQGQSKTLPVRISDLISLMGLQFTLEVRGVTIESITSGILDVGGNNYAIHEDGTLTFAWYRAEEVAASDVLFNITITAQKDIKISEALTFTDKITSAVAYDVDEDQFDVNVSIKDQEGALARGLQFELFQNEPNPFNQTTKIGFMLPNEGEVQLMVIDISGKVIHKQEGYYPSGYNEIVLSKDQLQTQGVIYYRLETSGHTDTRKMILID